MGSSREGAIKSAPAFTIVGRHKQPPPSTATYPGPGTYDGDYAVTMKKLPVYSVAPRLTYPEKRFGPGPAAHRPEKVCTSIVLQYPVLIIPILRWYLQAHTNQHVHLPLAFAILNILANQNSLLSQLNANNSFPSNILVIRDLIFYLF